jgi:hypothetical protein
MQDSVGGKSLKTQVVCILLGLTPESWVFESRILLWFDDPMVLLVSFSGASFD